MANVHDVWRGGLLLALGRLLLALGWLLLALGWLLLALGRLLVLLALLALGWLLLALGRLPRLFSPCVGDLWVVPAICFWLFFRLRSNINMWPDMILHEEARSGRS
jgi:hypothetical protein